MLWQLDLYDAPADNAKDPKKPLNGLLIPYLLASAGGLLWLCDTLRLIDMHDRFNLYSLSALGLLALGWFLRSKAFTLVSVYYSVAVFLMTFQTMVDREFSAWYGFGVIAVIAVALTTEAKRLPSRDVLPLHRASWSPYAFYLLAWWCVGLYLTHLFDDMVLFIALLVASTLAAALSTRLHARALSFGAIGYLLWAQLGWQIESLSYTEHAGAIDTWTAFFMMVIAIGLERFFTLRSVKVLGSIALVVMFATLLQLTSIHVADEWTGTILAFEAGALLAYAVVIRSRTTMILSMVATMLAVPVHLIWSYLTYQGDFLFLPTLCGFLAPIAMFIIYERGVARKRSQIPIAIQTAASFFAVASATTLSVLMLERIPTLATFYLTLSWSVLALVFFLFAVFSSQKLYRYAGLGILTLAILRVVFIDTTNLEPIWRVLAYGGLGIVLLATGLGYVRAFGSQRVTEDPDTSEAVEE